MYWQLRLKNIHCLHQIRVGWNKSQKIIGMLSAKQRIELFNLQIFQKKNIKGLAFSTQAQGVIPVDKNGNVLNRNISWVDGRAEEQARKAMNYFGGKRIFKLVAGTELTGKDVIPKIIWLKDKHPEIYNKTYKILDVNGYLKYKCTGKMVAEWSGACSYAFDVKKKDWERLFFKLCKIDLINYLI
jgi:xylulokinase